MLWDCYANYYLNPFLGCNKTHITFNKFRKSFSYLQFDKSSKKLYSLTNMF